MQLECIELINATESPAALSGTFLGDTWAIPQHRTTRQLKTSFRRAVLIPNKCNENVSASINIDPYDALLLTRAIGDDGQQRIFLGHTGPHRGAYINHTDALLEHIY
ncbi:MAG: hypothetical protein CL912_30845 [Deltaproteobacteria bacterium]|nr:hypothetical protein [Deltaproteobacteria bacterium]